MSGKRPRRALDAYMACAHRAACDRMAKLAGFKMWFSSAESAETSIADAYACELCGEWSPDTDAGENARLRDAVKTAVRVQGILCGDMDATRCREECPLHREETDDCLACDVIDVANELGINVGMDW